MGRDCPIIGLAGGIGAGKSAVAGNFERLGAVVISADKLAHQVLDSPDVRALIAEEFGPEVICDGEISRRALADRVFHDEALVRKLNSIVHPKVISETGRLIEEARREGLCPMIVIDAPLLFEAGMDETCDYIVFVDAPEGIRQERLERSRGWDKEELPRRERHQESVESKRRRADFVVDNSGAAADTMREVERVWREILAAGRPAS